MNTQHTPDMAPPSPGPACPPRWGQGGASLIELMVGLTIGMLVVLAATSTVMVTRQGSSTVSDRYRLTMAGNNAMRILSGTIRQAGSMEFEQPGGINGAVKFTSPAVNRGSAGGVAIVSGTEGSASPDTLTVSYQQRGSIDATGTSYVSEVSSDCLGNGAGLPAIGTPPERIDNLFQVTDVELRCNGTRGVAGTVIDTAQALVGDNTRPTEEVAVVDFQVRYLVQNATGGTRLVDASAIATDATIVLLGGWAAVSAVEVCLHLRGVRSDYPTSNFTDCAGNSVANGGRLQQVFRNTYRLRNKF